MPDDDAMMQNSMWNDRFKFYFWTYDGDQFGKIK